MSNPPTKFTRGPWHTERALNGRIAITHAHTEPGAISSPLAHVVARPSWREEAEANAALIRCAPTLYLAAENAANKMDQVARDIDSIEPGEAETLRHAAKSLRQTLAIARGFK